MSEDVLAATALTVGRGRRIVLSDVSLALRSGRAVHLAGANGSGKTSLLRVLAGLVAPRRGELRRTGTCAFVPERVQLASALRGVEWLHAMRDLRGLAPMDWAAAAAATGLEPAVLERPSAKLSKGMLQRVALMEAVHAGPAVLLLDEPFAGLDPEGRQWLAAQLSTGGPAVLLTDHSGEAAGRVALAGRLELRNGRCTATAAAASLTIRAVRAGERLERAVPQDASDARLGGRRTLDLLLVALVALALTVLFIGFPLALRQLAVPNLFEPAARPGDVAGAVLAHLCCSALGGALGVLFAPPRVTRRATATAAALAPLLALIAISRPLGVLGGPAAVAQTLSDAAAGTVDGAELAAALSCLALAAASLGAAGWWTRRFG